MNPKKSFTLCLASIALLISPAFAGDDDSLWLDDFDEAMTLAELTGKDLLVDFTGSDWCIWCTRLDEEVFAKEEFLEWVREKYVLVSLDFPKSEENKAKVKKPERNMELKEKFNVTGFPTVLLMDKAGKIYAKTGYSKGGPAPYIELLKKLKKTSAELGKAVEKTVAAEEGTEVEALTSLLSRIEKLGSEKLDFNYHFLVAFPDMTGMVKKAFELDQKNEAGLKLKAAIFLLNGNDFSKEVRDAIRELDPKSELGHLEKILRVDVVEKLNTGDGKGAVDLIDGFTKDKEFADKECEAYIMYLGGEACLKMLGDKDKAATYYKKSVELTTNTRMAEAISKIIAGIEEEKKAKEQMDGGEAEAEKK